MKDRRLLRIRHDNDNIYHAEILGIRSFNGSKVLIVRLQESTLLDHDIIALLSYDPKVVLEPGNIFKNSVRMFPSDENYNIQYTAQDYLGRGSIEYI